MKTAIALVTLLTLASSGCTYLTKSGRQQAAYAHYVKKMSKGRVKLRQRIVKAQKPPPPIEPSAPLTTTSTGPESVTSGSESQ